MHHKLITSRLIQKQSKLVVDAKGIRRIEGREGGASESSTMQVVGGPKSQSQSQNHVPLSMSLSQIVSMELGSDAPVQKEPPKKEIDLSKEKKEHPRGGVPPSIIVEKQEKLNEPRALSLPQLQQQQQHQHLASFRQQQEEYSSIQMVQLRQLQQAMFLYQHGAAANPSAAHMELLALQHQQQSLVAAAAAEPSLVPVPVPESPSSISTSVAQQPSNKRPRSEDEQQVEELKKIKREILDHEDGEGDDDSAGGHRFRPYQYEQWTEKFQELCDFRKARGHCQVPHTYKENPPLARWVKRQRYQYKLKVENKQSTMTDERIILLENIGFIWDSHAAAWAEKLNELKDYAQLRSDCNVPSTYPENPQLATWVKCQRRQYKLLRDGKTSNMTLERIVELEQIGFVWEVRKTWESGRK